MIRNAQVLSALLGERTGSVLATPYVLLYHAKVGRSVVIYLLFILYFVNSCVVVTKLT